MGGSPAPVPQYQQPADDPQYLALKAQADQDNINAAQSRVQIDSASLMQRYGARLSAANASAAVASPTMAAPAATADPRLTGIPGLGPMGLPQVLQAAFPGAKVA